jgi:short-subunit dehydrogenase
VKLQGKTIWITGASSGIGEALAIELSKKQNNLILSARRKEALENVKSQLPHPEKAAIVVLDLTDSESFNQKYQEAKSFFGDIDVLLNNGGISQRAWSHEAPLSVDRQVLEVNFFGAVGLTKRVLPDMLKNKRGQLIVISSVVGKYGFPMRTAYSASKHALHGWYESLRLEHAKNGIEVTLVMPGRIKTNISLNAIDKDGNKHGKLDKGQAEGIPADVCARKIISATENKKREVFIGFKEALLAHIKRVSPALFHFIASRVNPT